MSGTGARIGAIVGKICVIATRIGGTGDMRAVCGIVSKTGETVGKTCTIGAKTGETAGKTVATAGKTVATAGADHVRRALRGRAGPARTSSARSASASNPFQPRRADGILHLGPTRHS